MPNKYSKTLGSKSSSLRRKKISKRNLQSRNFNRRKKTRHLKIFLLLVVVFIVLGLLTYFLLFSNHFDIKKIQVNKLVDYKLVEEQEIVQEVYSLMNKKRLFLPTKNIFVFKIASLASVLEQDSRVAEFTINKKFPRQLNVTIKESLPIARLINFNNHQNYYLNEKGETIYLPLSQDFTTTEIRSNNLTFTTLEQEEPEEQEIGPKSFGEEIEQEKEKIELDSLPLFYNQTEVSLDKPEYINFRKDILGLINSPVLEQRQIKAELIKITTDKSIFEAEVDLNEDWLIFINSEADFDLQKNNLNTVLNEFLKRDNLEYIDLKFGQRIFYKLKEQKEKQY